MSERWWHDWDRVTAAIALGTLGLVCGVTVLIVVLAISRGCGGTI